MLGDIEFLSHVEKDVSHVHYTISFSTLAATLDFKTYPLNMS